MHYPSDPGRNRPKTVNFLRHVAVQTLHQPGGPEARRTTKKTSCSTDGSVARPLLDALLPLVHGTRHTQKKQYVAQSLQYG